ncbi:MAG: hypothetical protein Q9184_005831 [Pyrenodesmia sp. 2 TL-2023]
MTEPKMAIASAVIVPEEAEQLTQLPEGGKRKKSSASEERSKRPKLDTETNPHNAEAPRPPAASDRLPDRRRNGQMEERKRGQRLFGALLGTLSQSSSSTAQKRRTDIERKQQAKLRSQAEELDEEKKQRLEVLMVVRRKEQKKFDKQSMHIRHSNMLAQAHFLQTKAEPKLYYLPWELLPSEDAKIKAQVQATESTIQQETETFGSEPAEEVADSQADHKTPSPEKEVDRKPEAEVTKETVGSEANIPQDANRLTNDGSTDKKPEPSSLVSDQQVSTETVKDNDDDGGEMVEAGEDTVIY